LRANLFSIDNLLDLNFINELFENNKNIQKNEIVRNLLNNLATDLIENSMNKIQINKLKTIDDVYNAKETIINFSDKVQQGLNEIRNFLKVKMYNHKSVKKWNSKSEMVIEFLFDYFKKNYDKLPNSNSLYSKDRNIADYISGMTDKFALNIYENIN